MMEVLDGISLPEILVAVAVLLAVVLAFVVGLRRRAQRPDRDRSDEDRGGQTTSTLLEKPPREPEAPVEEPSVVDEPATDEDVSVVETPERPSIPDVVEGVPEAAPLTLGERFRQRLSRTRNVLGASVAELFGRGVDEEAWEGLEEALITADVGVTATMEIVEELRRRSREEGAATPDAILDLLKEQLRSALGDMDRSLARSEGDEPTVWLVTGVNGTGKTTSIGKFAAVEAREGRQVVLAAADTFRAAAAEQLGVWAERTDAHLVRKEEGADPASVAYEAYDAAVSRGADLLIIDTAGRLQNKRELMDELGKVKRVVEKQAGPLDETLLVLDATTGQNGISQARAFLDAVQVTGIVLTKLDGSARGGIVVAVQRELGIPVKYVGLGEQIDDLAPFDPGAFVEGLFAQVTE